jgi:hypothetical protein
MDAKQHTNMLNVAVSKHTNALTEMVQMDQQQKYMLYKQADHTISK